MKKYILMALVSFTFTVMADDGDLDCENALTTLDINQCAAVELVAAQEELDMYLEASYEHNAYDSELISAINIAQKDWEVYRSSHCDSVYTQWRDGTIRGVMAISCETRLTQQRTHEVWSNFLTYMDSTPPVLPEPKR
jgi:uncharacterized protein YecT (DUF1311 family)